MPNPFTQKYRSLSNKELLAILGNEEDYTPEALEAVSDEIDLRNISQEEIDAFQEEKAQAAALEAEKLAKAEEQKRQNREVAQSALSGFSDKKEGRLTRLFIGILAGVFGLIALFQIAVQAEFLYWMLSDELADWDISMVFHFLPAVFLPIAVVSFFLRKKTGWLLMGIYFIHSVGMAAYALVLSWGSGPGLPQLEWLFPRVNPLMFLFKLLFWAGSFWMLRLASIREVYEIHKKEIVQVFIIGTVWAILAIFSI